MLRIIMDKRILIALVAAIILGLGYFFWSRNDNTPQKIALEPTPTPSVRDRMQEVFGSSVISDEGEKLELSRENQMALVTRSEDKNSLSVLADLENPGTDKYFVWLQKEDGYKLLGELEAAKGGYVGEYMIESGWQDANHVVISRESVRGETPSNKFLEGSF